jgi:hypothetical protein
MSVVSASAVDTGRRLTEALTSADIPRRLADTERAARTMATSWRERRPIPSLRLEQPAALRRLTTADKEETGMLTIARRAVGLFFGAMTATMFVGAIAAISMRGKLAPTATTDPDADEIVAVSIFAPLAFKSTAKSFRGGTLDCWYGGGVLDLREATLDPVGAHLRIRGVFGGGQILVPETWRVETSVRGLGGMTDGRPTAERPADAPALTIDATVVFGGFAVLSEMPAEQADWMEKAQVGV